MEFKALKNIETAYQQLRRYSMAFLGLCALITVVAVWRSYSFAEKQRQKIYVLDNGKSLMLALSQDLWQNRPVEAREHVKRDLSEKGFFNRLIAGNVSQRIVVDSIAGNFNDYPYELRTYARQQIIRESYITERSLVTSCQLINTVRSDNNPQGFIIERFTVLENKDLNRYER